MGKRVGKGRSFQTYGNKMKKLEKQYKALCKASKKAEEVKKARSSYFHKKYPSFEKYRDIVVLKKETTKS